jgi:hypothetical protein
MTGRSVGALLVLALLAAAGGYALAPDAPAEVRPTVFTAVEPVPAAAPGLPVEIFRPDPDDPALEPALQLQTARLTVPGADGDEPAYELSVPVPAGWVGTQPSPIRWQYTGAGNDAQSYGLRIDILADSGLSVESARRSRESQLRSALYQKSFSDLEITPDDADGFTARYVQDGYERYSLERFYPGPDSDRVFASVAVYGRARDVTGLSDLLERISIDLRPVQTP